MSTATLAQTLRARATNLINKDTDKYVANILAACGAAADNGKFRFVASTNGMRDVDCVIKLLKADGFTVEKKENKDQRGEIESYSLVISW